METSARFISRQVKKVTDEKLAQITKTITDQIRWSNIPWDEVRKYVGLPPLPLTWTKCQGADLNLKQLTGFEFEGTLDTDTCIGFIETKGAESDLWGSL